jgi:uncharacterized membrane protein YdjX (TVP38/TMEM64 family)
MAEHLGIERSELAGRESRYGSPLAAMDSVRNAARGVAAIASHEPTEDDPLTTALTEVADPEAPLDPEAFVGDLFGARHVRPLLRRAEHLLIFPALLLVLIAAWRYLPVADWFSPQQWGPWLQAVSGSVWGGPAVVLAFVAGSIVIFPISVLIVATAVAFGPWGGFVWALSGCVLGAAANFAMGRWLGKRLFAGIAGDRFKTVSERLARGGIVPVMVIRNVPVAPFAVISIAAGASPIRLGDFLLGTTLGMAPGIGAVTLLGDRLRGVWQHPTALNLGLLGAAIVLWIGLALGLQSLSTRFWRR